MTTIWRWRQHKNSDTSSAADLAEKAEKSLVRIIQQKTVSEKILQHYLMDGLCQERRVLKYSPFLDKDNLLRIRGRLQNHYGWTMQEKHPWLLGKHHLTELLVSRYHLQRMHQGVEALLAFLYERFWIIGGRRLVRKVKSACIKCGKFDAKPCSEVTASLPHERVTHTTPFCLCWVD